LLQVEISYLYVYGHPDGGDKNGPLWANNPRQVRPEDARAIFEQAL
jgi:hypothetical protein